MNKLWNLIGYALVGLLSSLAAAVLAMYLIAIVKGVK